MSVIIVSLRNINDRLAFENQPMWKMKDLLEEQCILSEFITPYNHWPQGKNFRRRLWKFLFNLSRVRGFSVFFVLLLLLQGREVYHQVRVCWPGFQGIYAYDRVTAYAAAIACRHQVPVYLMSRNSVRSARNFVGADGLQKRSVGYFLLIKMLPHLLYRCRFHMVDLGAIAPNDVIPAVDLLRAS